MNARVIGLGLLFCMSMCKEPRNTSTPQISRDVNESQSKAVFIAEYQVSKILIDTNCKLRLDVRQVWIENVWRFKDSSGIIKKYEKLQLVLKPKDCDVLDSYMEDWGLCIDSNCKGGTGNCNMEMNVSKDFDKLNLDIVEFSSKYELNSYQKVGSIELQKIL